MSIVRVRLKDSRSSEFRSVSVGASSKDEAVAIVEEQEAKRVGYMIDPAEAVDLEKRLRAGTLNGRDKARIFTHMQARPYKVDKVVTP